MIRAYFCWASGVRFRVCRWFYAGRVVNEVQCARIEPWVGTSFFDIPFFSCAGMFQGMCQEAMFWIERRGRRSFVGVLPYCRHAL